ncbi:class I SAM-dependent methyltransferase [Candidatus Saccharibacteria bacterium]|nr:class I SAM-dependent methyltransferase [Candidatus Saccharibacteria bacterium]
MPTKSKKKLNRADHYNDPTHNYLRYWDGREYEHAAEELAIARLLKGKTFRKAVDVGGGYGRLSVFLRNFADEVTLAEPSQQQLDIAKEYLKDKPKVISKLAQAEDLPFKDSEVDLVLVVRVLHHLPDPMPAFEEINRVLKKDGYFLIEFANNAHFKNRLKYASKLQGVPVDPVDIRSAANRRDDEIPFVNHNPKTVRKQLAQAGFKLEATLSASNFRSSTFKKFFGKKALLRLEKLTQKPLAKTHFGPSTVYLLRKVA